MKLDSKFQVLRTHEFNEWLISQNDATQSHVLARLQRVSLDGHFGFTNHFDGLIELKWTKQRHPKGKKDSLEN